MSSQSNSRMYGPQHRICKAKVEIPTLCIDDRNNSLCVQWNGGPEGALPPDVEIPSGAQFLFPLLLSADPFFVKTVQTCFVPFLGQVKDWPADKNAIQKMIQLVGMGDPNKWIVWFLNTSVTVVNHPMQSGCVSIGLLGDPNCGVIVPELFSDLRIRDRAMALFENDARKL